MTQIVFRKADRERTRQTVKKAIQDAKKNVDYWEARFQASEARTSA